MDSSTSNDAISKWVQRVLDMGIGSLYSEYHTPFYSTPKMTRNAFEANQGAGRNRYENTFCHDQGRVVLNWPGAPTDYVHANYVSTPLGVKRFMCAQGPLDVTVNDFWMMILQEDTDTVLMLCNCIEKDQDKCAQYWPNTVGKVTTLGVDGIEITNKEIGLMSAAHPSVILTILSVKFDKPGGGQETREIKHFHHTNWPDKGVPSCETTIMELLSRVRDTQKPLFCRDWPNRHNCRY